MKRLLATALLAATGLAILAVPDLAWAEIYDKIPGRSHFWWALAQNVLIGTAGLLLGRRRPWWLLPFAIWGVVVFGSQIYTYYFSHMAPFIAAETMPSYRLLASLSALPVALLPTSGVAVGLLSDDS